MASINSRCWVGRNLLYWDWKTLFSSTSICPSAPKSAVKLLRWVVDLLAVAALDPKSKTLISGGLYEVNSSLLYFVCW